ncbi:MAG: glucose 1-dehydrogenase [Planctomycetota bacterium]|jgi:NAD(P)-dependent dehydrogenase (short-subunit alcohol dehydrogenase family)
MLQDFSLEGRNAIITGGTRGIGLAIARGFLEAGATVTVCGRKPEGAQAASEALAEHEGRFQAITAHVGKTEDISQLIDLAEERFGPVNVLVNNAGTNPYFGPIVESEDRAWDKTMDVNLRGPYALSREVAKRLIERGQPGSIVNVASVAGLEAAYHQGIYSVTKAGLIMLSKVMARELGQHNIRVNTICPGVIKTKLAAALTDNEHIAKPVLMRKALHRFGETHEIVGAAVYFASDASSFTTGATLQIDGGMVI